ncbi:OTU-like cysteine protease family protein [Cryptosporidium felis]|nr:OTU-like cysteine protease family protein [Cryptosporidium felis]
MDSDSQREQPSRRKILQRQNLEIKSLKEEWKKATANCNKKGSKKELEKEYNSKMESLILSHKIELLNLEGKANLKEDDNNSIGIFGEVTNDKDTSQIYRKSSALEDSQTVNELPSFYSNSSLQITKSEKRRKKKQKELEQKYIKTLEECSLNCDRKGEVELEVINRKLRDLGLKIHDIVADGNCLFGSIKHQMELKNMGSYSIKDLRRIAVDYIEGNREAMEPFVLASIENSDLSFEEYCDKIRDTNEWGGEVELVSLSNSLKLPITVIRSLNHRNEYYGEEFYQEKMSQDSNSSDNTLYIVYHVHLFANGPHYNSTTTI